MRVPAGIMVEQGVQPVDRTAAEPVMDQAQARALAPAAAEAPPPAAVTLLPSRSTPSPYGYTGKVPPFTAEAAATVATSAAACAVAAMAPSAAASLTTGTTPTLDEFIEAHSRSDGKAGDKAVACGNSHHSRGRALKSRSAQ